MSHESYQRRDKIEGSSNRTLGLVFAAVFLIIGVRPWFSDAPLRVWSLVVCALFVVVALAVPRILTPLNRVWTRFGLLLHKITSPVILGVLFFGVITPTGYVMRLLGRDALRLRFDRSASSYWVQRVPPGPKPDTLSDEF